LERFKHNLKEIWLDIKIINAVNGYFEKDKSYYVEGVKSLSVVGPSALNLREITLKNKNDFAS